MRLVLQCRIVLVATLLAAAAPLALAAPLAPGATPGATPRAPLVPGAAPDQPVAVPNAGFETAGPAALPSGWSLEGPAPTGGSSPS